MKLVIPFFAAYALLALLVMRYYAVWQLKRENKVAHATA
jgi:hypothetical protein